MLLRNSQEFFLPFVHGALQDIKAQSIYLGKIAQTPRNQRGCQINKGDPNVLKSHTSRTLWLIQGILNPTIVIKDQLQYLTIFAMRNVGNVHPDIMTHPWSKLVAQSVPLNVHNSCPNQNTHYEIFFIFFLSTERQERMKNKLIHIIWDA